MNCICPGPIRSAITERIPEEHKTIYAKRRTALGRYGDPEEVAHMTLSLCLPAASFLTGAVIPGGWRADGAERMTGGQPALVDIARLPGVAFYGTSNASGSTPWPWPSASCTSILSARFPASICACR